jgi:hypothetical protein
MADRVSDEELGVDVEQHPDSGMWRYLWVSPGGAEHIGLFHHNSEGKARVAGRQFAQRKLAEAEELRPKHRK